LPQQKAESRFTQLRDREKLGHFLSKKPALNAYPLGDLDQRYWDQTRWFGLEENGELSEVALLYSGMEPHILIGIPNSSAENLSTCLAEIQNELPSRVYAHLTDGLWRALDHYELEDQREPHFIMELKDREANRNVSTDGVFTLQESDFPEALDLFDQSYPGHWFRSGMLSFGPYFGIRDASGKLAAAGGVHVYSETYKVATIGNVVTHPEARGKGIATKVSARLVAELIKRVETVGLNVHAANASAIRVYEKLGFEKIADYFEMTLVRKQH